MGAETPRSMGAFDNFFFRQRSCARKKGRFAKSVLDIQF